MPVFIPPGGGQGGGKRLPYNLTLGPEPNVFRGATYEEALEARNLAALDPEWVKEYEENRLKYYVVLEDTTDNRIYLQTFDEVKETFSSVWGQTFGAHTFPAQPNVQLDADLQQQGGRFAWDYYFVFSDYPTASAFVQALDGAGSGRYHLRSDIGIGASHVVPASLLRVPNTLRQSSSITPIFALGQPVWGQTNYDSAGNAYTFPSKPTGQASISGGLNNSRFFVVEVGTSASGGDQINHFIALFNNNALGSEYRVTFTDSGGSAKDFAISSVTRSGSGSTSNPWRYLFALDLDGGSADTGDTTGDWDITGRLARDFQVDFSSQYFASPPAGFFAGDSAAWAAGDWDVENLVRTLEWFEIGQEPNDFQLGAAPNIFRAASRDAAIALRDRQALDADWRARYSGENRLLHYVILEDTTDNRIYLQSFDETIDVRESIFGAAPPGVAAKPAGDLTGVVENGDAAGQFDKYYRMTVANALDMGAIYGEIRDALTERKELRIEDASDGSHHDAALSVNDLELVGSAAKTRSSVWGEAFVGTDRMLYRLPRASTSPASPSIVIDGSNTYLRVPDDGGGSASAARIDSLVAAFGPGGRGTSPWRARFTPNGGSSAITRQITAVSRGVVSGAYFYYQFTLGGAAPAAGDVTGLEVSANFPDSYTFQVPIEINADNDDVPATIDAADWDITQRNISHSWFDVGAISEIGDDKIDARVRVGLADVRQLPEFPDEGDRDGKVAKFDGDDLEWETDAGDAAGLNEAQVDARVAAGVADWAETGDTSTIPNAKLPAGIGGSDTVFQNVAKTYSTAEALALHSKRLICIPNADITLTLPDPGGSADLAFTVTNAAAAGHTVTLQGTPAQRQLIPLTLRHGQTAVVTWDDSASDWEWTVTSKSLVITDNLTLTNRSASALLDGATVFCENTADITVSLRAPNSGGDTSVLFVNASSNDSNVAFTTNTSSVRTNTLTLTDAGDICLATYSTSSGAWTFHRVGGSGSGTTLTDAQIGDKAFSNPPSDLTSGEKTAVRNAIGAGTGSSGSGDSIITLNADATYDSEGTSGLDGKIIFANGGIATREGMGITIDDPMDGESVRFEVINTGLGQIGIEGASGTTIADSSGRTAASWTSAQLGDRFILTYDTRDSRWIIRYFDVAASQNDEVLEVGTANTYNAALTAALNRKILLVTGSHAGIHTYADPGSSASGDSPQFAVVNASLANVTLRASGATDATLSPGGIAALAWDDSASKFIVSIASGSGGSGLSQSQVDARVQAGVADWAEQGNTSAIPDSKIPSGIARDSELPSVSGLLNAEGVRDAVAAFITAGTGITAVHDDDANTLTLTASSLSAVAFAEWETRTFTQAGMRSHRGRLYFWMHNSASPAHATVTIPNMPTGEANITFAVRNVSSTYNLVFVNGSNTWTLTPYGLAIVEWNGSAWSASIIAYPTGGGSVVNASLTARGIVELATLAETRTGTDATRATTPAGVKAAIDHALGNVAGANDMYFGGLAADPAAALDPADSTLALQSADIPTSGPQTVTIARTWSGKNRHMYLLQPAADADITRIEINGSIASGWTSGTFTPTEVGGEANSAAWEYWKSDTAWASALAQGVHLGITR